MLRVGPTEFRREREIPIGMAEPGVGVQQRHRVQRDQLAVALPDHDWIDFQILGILIIEAGEQLPRKVRDLLGQVRGEAGLLRQLFQRVG